MDRKLPENDRNYYWTLHSKFKLMQYNLGPTAVKRIIRFPERKEVGIAQNTIAVMRSRGKEKNYREIWVMYQKKINPPAGGQNAKIKNKVDTAVDGEEDGNVENFSISNGKAKIISVWIYPGKSPKGKEIFVPDDVWIELDKLKERRI